MARPITLFTGQWADVPLEDLARQVKSWGYDGLELTCAGDHFDVRRALSEDRYVDRVRATLEKHQLGCWAISNHLVGQAICDPLDQRHKAILPSYIWGDGEPEGIRQRAAEEMMNTARAARLFGVDVVNGFTGSGVWHKWYFWPPTSQEEIDAGYQEFARRWLPILDVFKSEGVRFALEVHPTEIAYDIVTAQRALDAVDRHPSFGFNLDPSHFVHQFVDPVEFIHDFPERIFHTHMKDARLSLTGRNSILGSHLDFGDRGRGWSFVSIGHGDVKFGPLIRALNRVGYHGPLSVEWEDSGMDRVYGAKESLTRIRAIDFPPSERAFDSAFARE